MFRKLAVRALVVLLIAGAVGVAILMPPAAEPLVDAEWTPPRPIVRGVYHVHSSRSDGSGTVAEIAASAAQEGLQFVILTDHGDATRVPDPPAYRSGVLCIDAVEISTSGGHYVALGLAGGAPYPLGGPPRAVVEDVARLGGFGIVAHPDSAKPALRWDDWEADINGLEWLNADSEWRDETYAALARLLLTYWFRPVETLASAIDRPVATIERWDALTAHRRVPALAGADAHARIGFGDSTDPYRERAVARAPGYGISFRTFRNNVLLDEPFRGDAAADAASLLNSVREGRMFSTLDGLAPGGPFELTARSGGATARMGEYLDPQGPVSIEGRVAAPAEAAVLVLRNGVPIHLAKEQRFRVDVGAEPGAYRVEVRLAGKPPVPWLLTNPIYVGLRERHRVAGTRPPPANATGEHVLTSSDAQTEEDPTSANTLVAATPGDPASAAEWTFTLGDGSPAGQFAAMRLAVTGLSGFDRVTFRVSAERPMRAWVQLRASPGSLPDGERWGASFYADRVERDVTLFFEDFAPLGVTSSARPDLDRIDSILLVADTVNTQPGTSNTLRVGALSLPGR